MLLTILLLIGFTIADYILIKKITLLGGVEKNPITAKVLEKFDLEGVGIAKLLVILPLIIFNKYIHELVMVLVLFYYIYSVYVNARYCNVLRKN